MKPERHGKNAMKTTQDHITNGPFGGVFGLIADSLGQTCQFPPAGSTASAKGLRQACTAPASAAPERAPGMLARAGRWIWRRQMRGIAPQLARSHDVFERLDRWLWRQQMREIESYLAQSQDVFDLERRIKHLERGPDPRFC
jgi:hypothetical protein